MMAGFAHILFKRNGMRQGKEAHEPYSNVCLSGIISVLRTGLAQCDRSILVRGVHV